MYQYLNKRFTTRHKPTIAADLLTKELVVDDTSVTMQVRLVLVWYCYPSLGEEGSGDMPYTSLVQNGMQK